MINYMQQKAAKFTFTVEVVHKLGLMLPLLSLELNDVFPGSSSLSQSDVIRKFTNIWKRLQVTGLQMKGKSFL